MKLARSRIGSFRLEERVGNAWETWHLAGFDIVYCLTNDNSVVIPQAGTVITPRAESIALPVLA